VRSVNWGKFGVTLPSGERANLYFTYPTWYSESAGRLSEALQMLAHPACPSSGCESVQTRAIKRAAT
jgi:hypothetical protein